jgi:hypothetical protein
VKARFCFWSIATGPYAAMAQSLVDSARRVGVFKDFHIWTDRAIEGAICHRLASTRGEKKFIRLELLDARVRKLKYDYFVWLDADSYFVRHPGDILRVLRGAPVHASLESNIALEKPLIPDWGPCSLRNLTMLMQFRGVRSREVFTVNGGFWIVHREVVQTFCGLTWDFWEFCRKVGYRFAVEPLLAYASQMLCGNPYVHTLRHTGDLWATDRDGQFAGKVPSAGAWKFVDCFSGESFRINPAIIHAPRSQRALVVRGRKRLEA